MSDPVMDPDAAFRQAQDLCFAKATLSEDEAHRRHWSSVARGLGELWQLAQKGKRDEPDRIRPC